MLLYFYQSMFCKVHGIGAINVCTNFEINRYKIDEFRKHAKIVVLFDVTGHKNDTSYIMGLASPYRYFAQEHFETNHTSLSLRFKRYGSNCGFHDFGDLDILPMFYFCVTRTRHVVLESPSEVS